MAAGFLELGGGVRELADFSGADEGEIERPEKQDDVLTFELLK